MNVAQSRFRRTASPLTFGAAWLAGTVVLAGCVPAPVTTTTTCYTSPSGNTMCN